MKCLLAECVFLSEHESCSLRMTSKSPLSKSMSRAQNWAREQEPFHHPSAPSENPLSFGHVGWIFQSVCLFVMAVHLITKVPPDGAINEWHQPHTYADELIPLICCSPVCLWLLHLNTKVHANGAINERLQLHTYTDELIQLICPSPLEPVSGFYCT